MTMPMTMTMTLTMTVTMILTTTMTMTMTMTTAMKFVPVSRVSMAPRNPEQEKEILDWIEAVMEEPLPEGDFAEVKNVSPRLAL